ncbi:DUF4124 domain-containing protein [Leucothrix sargassi]|nr:DUF4124 domain-containing protein [Leucothrix sargassi]
MRKLSLLVIGLLSPSILMAAMYSWTDASGNLIFGDTPPQGVTAKEITPPKLTVLEGFATRYSSGGESSSAKPSTRAESTNLTVTAVYEQLRVIAPKQGQAIRANDGDVSAAVSFSPKLLANHQLMFVLDGQEVSRGGSKVANMANLDRGEHNLVVSIVDADSNVIISSENVQFSVLRASAIIRKNQQQAQIENAQSSPSQ